MLDGIKREQVAKTIGCTTESLRRWYAEGKKQGLVTKVSQRESKGDDTPATMKPAAIKPATAEPAATSAPHDPGAGLGEHEVKAILDHKKKHTSIGPADPGPARAVPREARRRGRAAGDVEHHVARPCYLSAGRSR
jgi:hypothetical protein